MDYNTIVLEGCQNSISSKNLKDYFLRKFKDAEKNEHFSVKEFFDGCFTVVKHYKKEVEHLYLKNMNDLCMILDRLEDDPDSDKDRIKNIENQLENLNKDFFYSGFGNYSQWQFVEEQLQEAMESLQPKKKTKSVNIEPLDFDLNQSEVIYLFDILQDAGFLKEPILHDGSYYRKLESNFTAKNLPIKDAEQKRQKYLDKPLRTAEHIKNSLLEALKKY